ncbi:zinc finger CCCH domain-containing protein 14 [Caerostris extrusa]|uniref:Zinc finger CCCH domain-containing protein 14 n=1 Tax=Caerostris extrusa TaxID=172846 RepID=A0AAV4TAG2_CAEEX|nr:zinc finger CCCH domain-containing protein 14 [Caerostris extrusa]
MDKSQNELTDKIRSAIKKKLIEINAFVDNELPDYIMILIANKRSKAHMEKDLNLFLREDTAKFTNWLWDLVNNLKINSETKQNKVSKNNDENVNKNLAVEDIDVLDCDVGDLENDLFKDDSSSDSRRFKRENPNVVSVSKLQKIVSSENETIKNTETQKLIPKVEINPKQVNAITQSSSKLMPSYKKINREDAYDSIKSGITGNVASVVRVTKKKYGRPAALQANKLLLRAVNDATKSVLDGKSINEVYKPTPINILTSTEMENNSLSSSENFFSINMDSLLDFNSELNEELEEPIVINENSNTSNASILENEPYVLSETLQNNRTICLSPLTTDLDSYNSSSNSFSLNQMSVSSAEDEKLNSPHFIVTLDGIDASFKRKIIDVSDEISEMDEEESFLTKDNSDVMPAKKQKLTERCKYWPACKNRDSCTYHHPVLPCQNFPECKFADKCFYIHPNCKFDALCSKKDCPFTHVSKRKFPIQHFPVKIISTKTVCKFYPKCAVQNCAFVHPKLCRYGNNCKLPLCSYGHFNLPPRDQMKWKAKIS